jgi:glycosyltransferase involved in cell wall biosynthesis
MSPRDHRLEQPSSLRFHVTSAGNEAMSHIASQFAEAARELGVPAEVVVDGTPLDDAGLSIVVAPHEFFPLHFVRRYPTIAIGPALARSAVINVEQPGSEWFDIASRYARRARHVFDISPLGVAAFERLGIAAIHAPLGYVPSLASPAPRSTADRTIDVLFLGHASARRTAFFARHAATFASMRCHLRLAELSRPRTPSTEGYCAGDARIALVANARIMLGVHSADRSYFEQHRAMLALANNCLLVTERSHHTAPLVDGVHFVSGTLDELPALCRRYLDDPEVLDAIATRGRVFLQSSMRLQDSTATVIATLTVSESALAEVEQREERERRAVQARIAESLRRRAAGNADSAQARNNAYDLAPAPAVSVVVTLFNYRQYIERCLSSVLAAHPPPGGLEIVVVDDGSTDGGSELVSALMDRAPMPMLLVRKAWNTGLADARNVGLEAARARLVFMLDADNWVFPSCFQVLHAPLDPEGPVATYGHIARIEDETGLGIDLLSSLEWSPGRLVEGPYLDAMALLDRQIVLSVGGYSTELVEHCWFGWEDYDLWLKLAQAGHRCQHVPQLVAGYRDHRSSMLRRTNRRAEHLAAYFRKKFAALIKQHPGLDTYFGFPDDGHASGEPSEVQRLRQQIVHLENELHDVHQSKSWLMTAPLRAWLDWLQRWGGRAR